MSARQVFFVARLLLLYPAAIAIVAYALTATASTFLDVKVAPITGVIVVLGVWYLSILLDAKAFVRKIRDTGS